MRALLKLKSAKYYSIIKNNNKKLDFNNSDVEDSENITSTVEKDEGNN